MIGNLHRNRRIGQAFRALVVLEALSFLFFALLHLGVRIPVGFATIGTDRIRDAAIAEGISGTLLSVSAYALLRRKDWALRATVMAQAFSLVAAVVGVGAIAAGLGPASPENDIYHRVMAPLHALSLIWLATPTGRCVSLGTTPEELTVQIAALLEKMLTGVRAPTNPSA